MVMSLPVEIQYRLDEFAPTEDVRLGDWTQTWRPLERGARAPLSPDSAGLRLLRGMTGSSYGADGWIGGYCR